MINFSKLSDWQILTRMILFYDGQDARKQAHGLMGVMKTGAVFVEGDMVATIMI